MITLAYSYLGSTFSAKGITRFQSIKLTVTKKRNSLKRETFLFLKNHLHFHRKKVSRTGSPFNETQSLRKNNFVKKQKRWSKNKLRSFCQTCLLKQIFLPMVSKTPRPVVRDERMDWGVVRDEIRVGLVLRKFLLYWSADFLTIILTKLFLRLF